MKSIISSNLLNMTLCRTRGVCLHITPTLFLRLKKEASGFPPECDTEESKRYYIRQYKEKEGINLEYEQIQNNPGLSCLAKLCLGSFWVKFGQILSMKQSLFFHESETDKKF